MVVNYLDRHLPVEITDMIYKMFHQSCMRDICNTINHKIVFVCVLDEETKEPKKMSFLICEKQNYNYLLGDEIVLGS